MTQFLPPNLLALFAPRDPIPYLPPVAKLPHEKKSRGYMGVSSFLKSFEDAKDTPPATRGETREERIERRRRERAEQVAYKLEQEIAVWDPNGAPNVTVDPFKTLFVARINYDTSESKLRREFEVYGSIKKIVLIHNSVNGKPRGYAFIEYEHERDMHSAYKHADGKKIDGRRVLVDVERARTVKGWLPRRLVIVCRKNFVSLRLKSGHSYKMLTQNYKEYTNELLAANINYCGGLGGTRRGGPEVNIKHSGREDNERERERYRLEREREERGGAMGAGGGGGGGGRMDRDRERGGGGLGGFERGGGGLRGRSRSRERRRRAASSRSRSPVGGRRGDKRRRSSKDRGVRGGGEDFDESFEKPLREKDKDRDRDRDRDRKRRRSRSRDKDKERRREKRERRDRDRGDRLEYIKTDDGGEVRIKEEPIDDYEYSSYPAEPYPEANVKYEEEDEQKYEPDNNTNGNNRNQYDDDYEEGEAY